MTPPAEQPATHELVWEFDRQPGFTKAFRAKCGCGTWTGPWTTFKGTSLAHHRNHATEIRNVTGDTAA